MAKLKWTTTSDDEGRTTVTAPAIMGRNFICSNGIAMELSPHFNGSGPTKFGGAPNWPHLNLDISFQQGEETKRDEFVRKLQLFIEENL